MSDFDSKFQHLSIFESKALQSVRLWLMKFKTCPILSWKFRNTSKSRKSCIQKFTWSVFVPQNWHLLPLSCFFRGTFLKTKQCALCQICLEKNHNVSDSELKGLQSVKTWIEIFTTCQILPWKFYCMSCSELAKIKRFRLWTEKYTTCQFSIGKFYYVLKFELRLLHRVRLLTKKFTACQVLTQMFHQVSHSESKVLHRFKFCMKKLATGLYLKYKFYNVSDFASKDLPLVKFWVGIITMFQASN